MAHGLKAPHNLKIDFSPSSKQYEVWNALQPECPICGGEVIQKQSGIDRNGHPTFHSECSKCGNNNIPQIILSGGAAGGGKSICINSSVCTPFGFKPLKDIKEGDEITNPMTGGVQTVLRVHPMGTFPFYRIHFVDGTHTDCSEGHLWRCHESRKKNKRAKNHNYTTDKIWETIDMFQWYQNKKKGVHTSSNLIIPITKPVQFTTKPRNVANAPIDPYVLGALIGDGCVGDSVIQHKQIQLTSMDQEIIDVFVEQGFDMSNYYQKKNGKAKTYVIRDKKLIKYLVDSGLAGHTATDKFIPEPYKYLTIDGRKRLMQGLMDTDGYVDNRGHLSYTTISSQLAEDVAFVIRSLGGVATITSKTPTYVYKGKKKEGKLAYTVYFRIPNAPELLHLTRKKERARDDFNGGASELGKRIVDIEYLGPQTSCCITVDDPSGLYVVDNFTVTHNSYLGSCWLIASCLRWPDMRMVVGRKTLKSLRESTWNTILSIVRQWGLVENENYKVNNLSGEMIFWNDSRIIMKEMAFAPADPDWLRLGSSEYSGAFLDEVGELDQRGVDVLFSRIRWKVHETFKVPKLLMSTNPCLGWVKDRFVVDENGDPVKCRPNECYIPFSVYDNPDEQFRNAYVSALLKITDPSVKERLLYGNWLWVDANDAAAYWQFDGSKHLQLNLKEKVYNPLKPLILSFDFNVLPFMSCLAAQIDYENKKIYILEEILGKPEDKDNNTPKLAEKIRKKYLKEKHLGGLFITGDPAGLARSTQTEEGTNNYTIIYNNLDTPVLRPKTKLLTRQPSQIARLEYINAMLDGFEGWQILIDLRCRKFTEDLIYQKKNEDGTKSKAKVMDSKLGVKYEKYGHLSDCFDYLLCLFINAWGHFQAKTSKIETTKSSIYGYYEY